ncbi:type II toxin-antitoxin system HicA family toxin [Patescibacteria group bacterium]|nr:type II toxin-antitoxin system HicA family toxin [Patescibacteria group bacterium]
MPKLKTLSGEEVLKIFLSFGFNVAAQKSSHIKLVRVQKDGTRQTLTIPNHFEKLRRLTESGSPLFLI